MYFDLNSYRRHSSKMQLTHSTGSKRLKETQRNPSASNSLPMFWIVIILWSCCGLFVNQDLTWNINQSLKEICWVNFKLYYRNPAIAMHWPPLNIRSLTREYEKLNFKSTTCGISPINIPPVPAHRHRRSQGGLILSNPSHLTPCCHHRPLS